MRKKLEITERELGKFTGHLRREEREDSTIESYMRTARRFAPRSVLNRRLKAIC